MASKKYDIVCKTGEYTNREGETKANWKNVGAVMVGDNGPFIMLDKTFNPAGLESDGRSSVLLSLFEPKDKQQPAPHQQSSAPNDLDDDIPF